MDPHNIKKYLSLLILLVVLLGRWLVEVLAITFVAMFLATALPRFRVHPLIEFIAPASIGGAIAGAGTVWFAPRFVASAKLLFLPFTVFLLLILVFDPTHDEVFNPTEANEGGAAFLVLMPAVETICYSFTVIVFDLLFKRYGITPWQPRPKEFD